MSQIQNHSGTKSFLQCSSIQIQFYLRVGSVYGTGLISRVNSGFGSSLPGSSTLGVIVTLCKAVKCIYILAGIISVFQRSHFLPKDFSTSKAYIYNVPNTQIVNFGEQLIHVEKLTIKTLSEGKIHNFHSLFQLRHCNCKSKEKHVSLRSQSKFFNSFENKITELKDGEIF